MALPMSTVTNWVGVFGATDGSEDRDKVLYARCQDLALKLPFTKVVTFDSAGTTAFSCLAMQPLNCHITPLTPSIGAQMYVSLAMTTFTATGIEFTHPTLDDDQSAYATIFYT